MESYSPTDRRLLKMINSDFVTPSISRSRSIDFSPSMEYHAKSSVDTVRLSMCNDLSCSEQYLIPDASTTSITIDGIEEPLPSGDIQASAKILLLHADSKDIVSSPPSPQIAPIPVPLPVIKEEKQPKRVETPVAPVASPQINPASVKYSTSKPFLFPIYIIPPKREVPLIDLRSCSNVVYITDGSNANIYGAMYEGEKVIIKMIKEKCQNNTIAVQEFDMELSILSRIDHPNIIKVIGAGNVPRKFIVLECLEGGSLNGKLKKNIAKTGWMGKMTHRHTFPYRDLLQNAKELADALDYLHTRCYKGVSIIHRDLKPDNIGFGMDGKLKIFDFGLSTCVKARKEQTEAYKMTGYTGSLRYMAPEVALRQTYTERVDVYSFGLIMWQMARDRVPFQPYNKQEILQYVVSQHERPKLSSSWPPKFCQLLCDCWNADYLKRPSFAELVRRLTQLQQENEWFYPVRRWMAA